MQEAACKSWKILATLGAAWLTLVPFSAVAQSPSVEPFAATDWPFVPLERPAVPAASNSWVENPVDTFVGEELEKNALQPSRPADRLTLLRRLSYDLTGLPPTLAEQEEFLADAAPDAYERLVDRLLASPRFGERWGQHWLDVVRYSETCGFKNDDIRPEAYRYRDYVIQSFNADRPYNEFVAQQIAGDELAPHDHDALVAAGYLRLYPEEINASNFRESWQTILDNITDVSGEAFLGLTMGCARCHDHKFDPILHTDYYGLQACFATLVPSDSASIASDEEERRYFRKMNEWEMATADIRGKIDQILADERQEVFAEVVDTYDGETEAAMAIPEEKRTALQKQITTIASTFLNKRLNRSYRRCDKQERARYDELDEQLASFDSMKPAPLPHAMTVCDVVGPPPVTRVLTAGNYRQPAEETPPGFPEFLGASRPTITPPAGAPQSSGRRSALARWLTRPDHPLTARVMVNRVWQHLLGEGIVATPNDFGAMGAGASHPALLDWLAADFVAQEWQIKQVVETIVTSATYQQASTFDPQSPEHLAARAKDPANRLLWRANRKRLEGEAVRDTLLAVSGGINLQMLGPSAKPELPAALAETGFGWEPDEKVSSRQRRSIYVFARRNLREPLLAAFDATDAQASCPRRPTTTTAPQSLALLNGKFALDEAHAWAERLTAEFGEDEPRLIAAAYRQAFGRLPDSTELEGAQAFLTEQRARGKAAASPVVLTSVKSRTAATESPSAVADFCHALLNASELIYVD